MRETNRIKLYPLSLKEYILYLKNNNELSAKLNLNPGFCIISKEHSISFRDKISNYITENPEHILFATVWIIIIKNIKRIAGHIHFKGKPDESGMIETGYRIFEEFKGKGIATESLKLITDWAFSKDEVRIINAYTDIGNLDSQNVLLKCGFSIYSKTDKEIEWRKVK